LPELIASNGYRSFFLLLGPFKSDLALCAIYRCDAASPSVDLTDGLKDGLPSVIDRPAKDSYRLVFSEILDRYDRTFLEVVGHAALSEMICALMSAAGL